MKIENVVVGMRVKVKQRCIFSDIVGSGATVVDIRDAGLGFEWVVGVCVDNGLGTYFVEAESIKPFKEQPVVGDRVVITSKGYFLFSKGCQGNVVEVDSDKDFKVVFDTGSYSDANPFWFVQHALHNWAIVREVA